MEQKIREEAYRLYKETGETNTNLNWELAQFKLWRQDYYREKECPHCKRKPL